MGEKFIASATHQWYEVVKGSNLKNRHRTAKVSPKKDNLYYTHPAMQPPTRQRYRDVLKSKHANKKSPIVTESGDAAPYRCCYGSICAPLRQRAAFLFEVTP